MLSFVFLSFYIQVYSSFNFQNTTIVEYQNKTIASDEIIITVLHAITTGNKMPEVLFTGLFKRSDTEPHLKDDIHYPYMPLHCNSAIFPDIYYILIYICVCIYNLPYTLLHRCNDHWSFCAKNRPKSILNHD